MNCGNKAIFVRNVTITIVNSYTVPSISPHSTRVFMSSLISQEKAENQAKMTLCPVLSTYFVHPILTADPGHRFALKIVLLQGRDCDLHFTDE